MHKIPKTDNSYAREKLPWGDGAKILVIVILRIKLIRKPHRRQTNTTKISLSLSPSPPRPRPHVRHK